MSFGQYRNRSYLRGKDPKHAEALDDLQTQINQLSKHTSAPAQGVTGAPPQITALNVVNNLGVIDVQIVDNNSIQFGINYFLEWSLTSNFATPFVIDLGASRNWRGMMGVNAKGGTPLTFWRAYSQYWGGLEASSPTYFGTATNPTAVGAGLFSTTVQSSTGSGTAKGDGTEGGSGLGPVLDRRSGRNSKLD